MIRRASSSMSHLSSSLVGSPHAVIVDVVRTASGRRGGALSHWHPADLAAETLNALVERSGIDPAQVDDVIVGCVSQVGEQGLNVARNAVLAAGWPHQVPATTVDRQNGSSQQALHFAAQGVMAGAYDVVVAGGVEAMTRVPLGSTFVQGTHGSPFGPALAARYESQGGLVPPGFAAEFLSEEWQIGRDEMDEYAARSHERGLRASEQDRFDHEIIPVAGDDGQPVTRDEGICSDMGVESLAAMRPLHVDKGRITAGNSAQIADGASAALVMGEHKASELGLTPRARIVQFSVAAVHPRLLLTAPIPATRDVLRRASLGLDEIDLIEINEEYAAVVLAWRQELRADLNKVNVNGGAIALGDPLGASGTKLMATLLNELERSGGRYGLQTMCEAGGMANATIIERLG
jgi:acetyl-CoA acyltransferase